MNKLLPCKFCGTMPQVRCFGENHVSIFCPAPDDKCYPGAWVEDVGRDTTMTAWNQLYGKVEAIK